MMKRCPKCCEMLPAEAFSRRNARSLNSYCKVCQRVYCRSHYKAYDYKHNKRRYENTKRYIRRNRRNAAAYLLEHPCVDCGEADIRVLEFDHVRGVKVSEISQLVALGCSWRKIEEEIEKCVVRCANCHRRKTVVDRGWYKGMVGGM
jgi:hypothetical protein